LLKKQLQSNFKLRNGNSYNNSVGIIKKGISYKELKLKKVLILGIDPLCLPLTLFISVTIRARFKILLKIYYDNYDKPILSH
jgi:hypothetical protein